MNIQRDSVPSVERRSWARDSKRPAIPTTQRLIIQTRNTHHLVAAPVIRPHLRRYPLTLTPTVFVLVLIDASTILTYPFHLSTILDFGRPYDTHISTHPHTLRSSTFHNYDPSSASAYTSIFTSTGIPCYHSPHQTPPHALNH